MAMSLNKAQIIGNLTRDPELRQTPNGTTVCSFSVATNFTWKDQMGNKQEKVEFHNIVAWGKLAEICGQYLNKGKKVFLEGRIQTRDWEGEDGVKRYKTEIIAENMIMLSRGDEMSGGSNNYERSHQPLQQQQEQPVSQPTPAAVSEEEITIDDLPF
jgi:single-strand DNA-binding protein